MKPPCKGCSKRFIGCHSKCEEFSEYSRQHEIEKEAEKLTRRLNSPSIGLIKYREIKKRERR